MLEIILSSMVQRCDKFNKNMCRVNYQLQEEGDARNICFIEHRNISDKKFTVIEMGPFELK